MTTLSANEARASLVRPIDQTAESHRPVFITGKRNRAVLLSTGDWQAIQEMLHLPPPAEPERSLVVDQATHNRIISFIWDIADAVLRDLFKRGKYEPDAWVNNDATKSVTR
jgi:PHD/YefM family antitoxin component YafN of YafNO toxin-antitoxin module